jgi:formylglycine-generating enzyme required for sulfatase activity/Tfp pilus assembly protein PilF
MVLIPAGPFEMGSDPETGYAECQKLAYETCEYETFTDAPPHTLVLNAYYIDQYEVANAQYAECVVAGECIPPAQCHYGDPTYDDPAKSNHPVVCASGEMAETYCAWRGGRLPSEAEWEKAARGPQGNIYPWGNTFDGNRANFCDATCPFEWANAEYDDGYAQTAPVGNYPDGTSAYGVYDMAGNVSEWTHSKYADYPYVADDGREIISSTEYRVTRGGAWNIHGDHLLSVYRDGVESRGQVSTIGFRCAKPIESEFSAMEHADLGAIAYAAGDLELALEHFSMAIALDPQMALAYQDRAVTYINLQEYEKAIQDLNVAIELEPDHAASYNNRGHAYHKLGKDEKAIADFDKSLELAPAQAETYLGRGQAYNGLGNFEKALADLDRAIELDPEPLTLSYAYADRGYAKFRLDDLQGAFDDLYAAIELDPELAVAYNTLGLILGHLGDYEEALRNLDESIALDPEYGKAYYNRGAFKLEMEDYEEALLDLDRAIELEPNRYYFYYQSRAKAYIRLERHEQALADLNMSIELAPHLPGSYVLRAMVYKNLGDFKAAANDLDRFLELETDPEEIQIAEGMLEDVQTVLSWEALTSTQGGFAIRMPGAPELQQQENLAFYQTTADGVTYLAGYSDLAAVPPTQDAVEMVFLETISEIAGNDATYIHEATITLEEHPGKHVVFTTQTLEGRLMYEIRLYLVEERLYRLQVSGSSDVSVSAGVIDGFFSSFKLVEER